MSALEKIENLYGFALSLLDHPEFGLKQVAQDSDDLSLVNQAIELVTRAQSGEQVSRGEWTQLKEDSFRRIGSPIADCISRICSAMRNPQQAGISGLRDGAEKLIQANIEAAEQRVKLSVQQEMQKLLAN